MLFTSIKGRLLASLSSFGSGLGSAFNKLWTVAPDGDNLRNRRNLAFWSAIYGLLILPQELILLNLWMDLNVDIIKALLTYIGAIVGGSIAGYIWSSMKDDELKKAASNV